MPKVRTLRYLLDLYEEAERKLSDKNSQQTEIRRRVYPAVPEDGWKSISKRYLLSATIPRPPDNRVFDRPLCVLRLGYTNHRAVLCETWSIDWYEGQLDPQLLRTYARVDVSKPLGGDMESLAFEGKLSAWTEVWEQTLGHTPENARLVQEYVEVDDRIHDLRRRSGIIYREIQNSVMATRPKIENPYSEDRYSVFRYLLPDGKVFSSNRDGFSMSDCALTIPITYELPASPSDGHRNWMGSDGNNA